MIQAIFIDLDDTLLQTRDSLEAARLAIAMDLWGESICQVTNLVSYRLLNAWQRLTWYFASDDLNSLLPILSTELVLPKPSNTGIERAEQSFQKYQIEGAKLQTNAMTVLRRWHSEGKQLAIVSNGNEELQRKKIERVGLAEVIPSSRVYVINPRSVDAKPRPGLIERALADMAVDPHEAIVIGDRTTDIIAGKLAQCHTILFLGRGPEAKLPPPAGMLAMETPDAYAVDWDQVAAVVKNMF